jgi:uncharacterized protein YecE (DUF72 family)
MVRGWHDRSPEGFVFAVKGSRFLTHMKRLTDTGPGLRKYFSRLGPLADRTGPILWQLPPNFERTDENFQRLARFLKKLPTKYQHAVEFRHPSWMNEQTFDLLRAHKAANVWLSSLRMPQDYTVTANFVYLRFHGLKDGAYHDYTADELAPWAEQLRSAARRGLPCYVYFNNDLNTRAPLNAEALMKMVGQHVVPAFDAASATELVIKPPRKLPETWPPWIRAGVNTLTRAPKRGSGSVSRRRARSLTPAQHSAEPVPTHPSPSARRRAHSAAPARPRKTRT